MEVLATSSSGCMEYVQETYFTEMCEGFNNASSGLLVDKGAFTAVSQDIFRVKEDLPSYVEPIRNLWEWRMTNKSVLM